MTAVSRLVASLFLVASCAPSWAADGEVIFFLDKDFAAKARLDRLPADNTAARALLALYALENGTGCQGKDDLGRVRCELTSQLGLGFNCSAAHIDLVRTWFERTPRLTPRWNDRWHGATKEAGALEGLCYGQPNSASWQNTWEIIRMRFDGKHIDVDAILFWLSPNGHGRIRYQHTYRVDEQRITEVSSSVGELSRSDKSISEK